MNTAIYPGTFDPITNGHYNIIERCSTLFDELIVLVMINPNKSNMFSIEERVQFIKKQCKGIPNVRIERYEGLLIQYANDNKCNVIIKGIRNTLDFEYETQMALINKSLKSDLETLFMVSDSKYSYVSSSTVKEIFNLNGDVKQYVSKDVMESLQKFK